MKPQLVLLLLTFLPLPAADVLSYNRDVRPILSDKCFSCHGPDAAARKAKLRLDLPGADTNEIITRITHPDPDERMPPAEAGSRMTDAQIRTLRRWIAEGANYERHWSLIPPRRPPVPLVDNSRIRNAIDAFVMRRLQRESLVFSAEAGRAMLIRRLSLALTGLPPTIREVDALVSDHRPGAFDRLVDRLLSSAHYGERMAGRWLDAARYADTNGYFTDNERTMWPWRDWVINAFNANMPFDQFTIEQLAGDLLPNATREQKIATGFNRNHMVNNESGLIPEEFRVEYVADRVKTTSTVWMGLTMECARCHDHKYDPISQRDYYRFFAFFNNVPEKGLDGSRGNAAPLLNVATAEQKTDADELKRRLAHAEKEFKPVDAGINQAQRTWETIAFRNLPAALTMGMTAHFPLEKHPHGFLAHGANFKGGEVIEIDSPPDIRADQPFTISVWVKPSAAGCILSKMDEANRMRGFDLVYRKNKILVHLVNEWAQSDIEVRTVANVPGRQWSHLLVTYDGSSRASGLSVYLNGVEQALNIDRDHLRGSIANDEPLRIGRRKASASYKGVIDDVRFYDRELSSAEADRLAITQFLRGVLSIAEAKRDRAMKQRLRDHYLARHATDEQRSADQKINRLRKELSALKSGQPVMMVMSEMKQPRQAYLLERGEYNKQREKLNSGVPSGFGDLPDHVTPDRLGLARWLMHPDNPLTARVIVNRVWAQLFGRGLVATPEDFGTQGAWPEHPELLDWLACEFRNSGWDLKRLVRLIVSSTTFRQTSHASPELIRRDPSNQLLARGPRIRMDAETLRDNALAVSGLLVVRHGGPSVKPYQPAGLWKEMTYDGQLGYATDTGANLYRRSLYTYWKRQAPPPNMLLFDAPTRETCTVARPRTNTPLQALVLMNDPTFVEAARHLAAEMMRERDPIRFGFRSVLARPPTLTELQILTELDDSAKLSGLTKIASLILCLDEAITQP